MTKILKKGCGDYEKLVEFAKNCSWVWGRRLGERLKGEPVSDGTDGFPEGAFIKDGTKWEILVADFGEDGSPRGFGMLSSTDFPEGDYTPWVANLFVEKEHRGQRISQKIIDLMEKKAKELGYDRIYLVTDHVNLYEKYGYEKFDTCSCPWDEKQVESLYQKAL